MENSAYTASFARIYDEIMKSVPYKFWYDYINEIMDYYQLKAEKVLDLACGTGNMSLLYAKNSYQVTGIDRSEEMLKIAGKKAREAGADISFINADLCEFRTEEKYDLAISLFDSLNYILDIDDLKKVFSNVYQALKEDGIFIFDVNTITRLMSINEGTTFFHGKDYTCIWEDTVDEKNKLWQVRLKIYFEKTGEYHEEFHQERGYKIDSIKNTLQEAGFQHIDVYNAYTLTEASDDDDRVYFVVFKNKRPIKKKKTISKFFINLKWGIKRILLSLRDLF
ncbi:MAG: class I SAM-dependent methyltransferase [Halanaerobiaceae bacterium]|nr:class I SAM-dependent methyltransferase [Halanaerobiaceae bacterium]